MAKKTIASELASVVGTAAGTAAARVDSLKPKRSTAAKHSKAKAIPIVGAVVESIVSALSPEVKAVEHEDVARLAYLYWEARGGRNGSAEQDWILAEAELKAKAAGR